MRSSDPTAKPSYTGNGLSVPGKGVVQGWPTPNLDDRILVVRKDTRAGGYVQPNQGDPYTGPNAANFDGFLFCTIKPSDMLGWVDLYYLNVRANQDDYNFEVEFPYTDHNYPKYTRTYVVLRDDDLATEPDADTTDPVHTDLLLTDHKWLRLQDPALDALFIGVQRVYERLPGPVIVSYDSNQAQQVVTVNTQEVESESVPVLDARTEIKVERLTTAKAKVVTSAVPDVFSNIDFKLGGEDPINPYRFRKFAVALPASVVTQTIQGTAAPPTFGTGDFSASDHQVTEFKQERSVSTRQYVDTTLVEYKLTPEQQIATVTEHLHAGGQSLGTGPLLVEGEVTALGNGATVLSQTSVGSVFQKAVFVTETPDPLPTKFRVALPTTTTEQTQPGTASQPVLGTGDLRVSDTQETVYKHRVTDLNRNLSSLGTGGLAIIGSKLNSKQQVMAVVENLARGLQTITPSLLVEEASVEALGDGTSLLTVEGPTALFGETGLRTSVSDGISEEMKAKAPLIEAVAIVAGTTASQPVLGTGVISSNIEQISVYRQRQTGIGRVGFPVTLINHRLNPEQQDVTITETLAVGLQALPTISATFEDASTKDLGNNTSLLKQETVGSVFPRDRYVTSGVNLLPEEFRNLVPEVTHEFTTAGTASQPVLSAGQISASDEQLTVYKHRVSTSSLGGVTGAFLTGRENTEEYGGGMLDVAASILTGSEPTTDTGLTVVSSVVKALSPNTWLKESKFLDGSAWPTLTSTRWDEEMQTTVQEQQQVVAQSYVPITTSPGDFFFEQVKKIDIWRSLRIKTFKTPTYTSIDHALITDVSRPYRFPGYLLLTPAGNGWYLRGSHAEVVQHKILTWWSSSSTEPDPYGYIQPIRMNNPVIGTLNDETVLTYAGDCLHNAITSFGSFSYAATIPSTDEYLALCPPDNNTDGPFTVIGANVTPTDIPYLWKTQLIAVQLLR